MDGGFKGFMRKLKRVHFWILCSLVIVLGMVAWFLSVGSLKSETATNSGKINSLYSTVNSVRTKGKIPNDKVAVGMEKLIEQRRSEVADAWTERWNQQTDILTWPEELSEKFRRKVEDLRPIESHVSFPVEPHKELVRTLRQEYQEHIKKELVKLAAQIGSRWMPSGQRGNDRPRNMERNMDQLLVLWSPENQAEIESNHFDWSTSRDGIPTLLEILYAQEDLWVLRSIMGVIERSNEGATTRFSAAVKEIHSIEMGRNAARTEGSLIQDSGSLGGDPREPGMREPGMREPGMREPGMQEYSDRGERFEGSGEGGQEMGGQSLGPDPAENRYVDKNYQPLDGGRLRSVMSSGEEVAPEDATLAVAKRIPVRLRLRVDQRKLNRVLAECASADLTIEVRQVRINANESQSTSPVRLAEQQWQPQQSSGSASAAEDLFQYDVDVELFGIVYIYNPVDKGILGITEEEPTETAEPAPTDETATIWPQSALPRSDLGQPLQFGNRTT